MSKITWRHNSSRSTHALVLISPASTTMPVFTMVSQATRASGSSVRIASRTASEIWSAILSGWPSETDSEVNIRLLMGYLKSWRKVGILPAEGSRNPIQRVIILQDQGKSGSFMRICLKAEVTVEVGEGLRENSALFYLLANPTGTSYGRTSSQSECDSRPCYGRSSKSKFGSSRSTYGYGRHC